MKNIIIGLVILVVLMGGYFILKGSYSTPTGPIPSPMQQKKATVTTAADTITISNFSFTPSTLTIKKGATVTWVNQDSVTHSIKSDSFNSNDLNSGESFKFTFDTTGSFDYHCGIHPSMTGKIVVE